MSVWSLSEIRSKVRKVTGRLSFGELTNNKLDDYINKYLQYTFTAEVKLDRVLANYSFITKANQQIYDGPSDYVNLVQPATIDNLPLEWYQDKAVFDSANPEGINKLVLGTGDAVTTVFSDTVSQYPILPGTLYATDDLEIFEDTNTDFSASSITIIGSLGGTATIDYSAGTISLSFSSAPATGQEVYAKYSVFNATRPQSVLWYNDKFKLYPVPDAAYKVDIGAYFLETVRASDGTTAETFVSPSDRPLLDQWGPAISYGTARDIHADHGEMDAYQEVTALYKEQIAYVLKRTHQNLLNTRIAPSF